MQTDIQTQPETPVEIMPCFSLEMEKIAGEYREARNAEDNAKVDEAIDFHLRSLLLEQCDYMKCLCRNAVQQMPFTPWDFFEKRYLLESLVFNEKSWNEFSQKLKSSRGLYTSLQLAKYAN